MKTKKLIKEISKDVAASKLKNFKTKEVKEVKEYKVDVNELAREQLVIKAMIVALAGELNTIDEDIEIVETDKAKCVIVGNMKLCVPKAFLKE